MWTSENRERYNRDHLRYPSDLTEEEWRLIEPLIPTYSACQARREQAARQRPGSAERHYVRFIYRLPMAIYSQRPAAAQYGARLF